MDLAIIDTYVRTDNASKATPRSSDEAPESFAELLDTRMRQPEPAREKREAAETHDIPEAGPADVAETRPSEPAAAAKPRIKPKAEHEAKDAADTTANVTQIDAEELAEPAKTPAAGAAAASLVAELLNAGNETSADGKPTGLEIATAIVTNVTPEKAAASAVLSRLLNGTMPQGEEAPASVPTPATNTVTNPTPAATAAAAAAGATPDFALQLNAATPDAPAAAPVIVKTPDAPAATADLLAATSTTAASVASELAPQADEPTPADMAFDLLVGGEGDDALATVTMGTSTPSAAPRPASGPMTTPAYAAQLASQEPTAETAPTTTTDMAKAVAAVTDKTPEGSDVAVDVDTPLPAPTLSQDPFIAHTTSENSVRASAQTEAAAQRGPRPAALPVAEQVAVRITKALADGIDRITVKLNPADLGQIDIRMEIGPDGKFNAVFAADRPQTVELLQRDARELARSLQDAGLRADAGSLSFNLRGQNQGQQNGSPLTAFQEAGSGTNGGEALPEGMPLPATLYGSANAANGRVDIRV